MLDRNLLLMFCLCLVMLFVGIHQNDQITKAIASIIMIIACTSVVVIIYYFKNGEK